MLIHAGKWWNQREVAVDIEAAEQMYMWATNKDEYPVAASSEDEALAVLRDGCGYLLGSVEIVDCVAQSSSPWFVGDYGFMLRDPIVFAKPVAFKGALGFFSVPDELARSLQ